MKAIPQLSSHSLRLLRTRANRLAAEGDRLPTSVVAAASAVVGLQAQDLAAAGLSVRARSHGLTAEAVKSSHQASREIIWSWSLRGTLHLVTTEDFRWLLPLLSPGLLRGHKPRFRQLGWDDVNAASGMKLLREALERSESMDRAQIASLLQEHQLPFAGQATQHLIYRAALEGWLCPGPLRGAKPRYVLTESWIGALQPLPPMEALSRLALRYLEAFAPAAPQDLAVWSGLRMGEVRQGWEQISDRLVEVTCQGQQLWLLQSQTPWLDAVPPAMPVVRLLGRFDTYLLGYASRDFCVPAEFARRVHPGGGIIHRVLLVDGLIQGTWEMAPKRKQLELRLKPFHELPGEYLPLLQSEVLDLGRFLENEIILNLPA